VRLGPIVPLILCLLAMPASWAPGPTLQTSASEAVMIRGGHLASLVLPVSVRTLNSPPTVEIELDSSRRGTLSLRVKPYDPNTEQDIRVLRLEIMGPTSTHVCVIEFPFQGKSTIEGDLKPQASAEGELIFKIARHKGEYTALCLVEDEEYRTVTALSWQIR